MRVTADPAMTSAAGPQAGGCSGGPAITFTLADPGRELAGVRLRADAGVPGDRLDFRPAGTGWELVIGRPPVTRLEYLLELRRADGTIATVTDPGNPLRVSGAFGQKSVREFPCYTAPAWLTAPAGPAATRELEIAAAPLGAAITAAAWAPAGTPDEQPLPLLIVHDGQEYDRLASLGRYLSAGVAGGWLPPLRAALLAPGPRDRWYSANAGYSGALRQAVIPALAARWATTARIGMGTSLGALAMLHAHCRQPDAFDALFLQSGSFFTAELDSQERRFRYFRRIAAFVAGVHAGHLPGRPVPVSLTCGAIEENAANNRLMTATLRAHGYDAALHEVPDVHNYTAWRDAFDPHLTRLLGRFRE